jgi:hypothetical protein
MGERWNQKLAAFRAQLAAKLRPIKVEPKHTPRHSGPRIMPSDRWMDAEYQKLLGPQCTADGCHQNLVKGQELVDGLWCGSCAAKYSVTRRRAMGGDDLPPAAA